MTQTQWDARAPEKGTAAILVHQVAAAQQLDEVQGLLDAADQLCDSLQT